MRCSSVPSRTRSNRIGFTPADFQPQGKSVMQRLLLGLIVGVALSAAHAPALGAGGDAHGAHEHIGHVGVKGNPSEIQTDLAIYTFVVFLLLLAILYKFAWGPISSG